MARSVLITLAVVVAMAVIVLAGSPDLGSTERTELYSFGRTSLRDQQLSPLPGDTRRWYTPDDIPSSYEYFEWKSAQRKRQTLRTGNPVGSMIATPGAVLPGRRFASKGSEGFVG